VTTRLGAVLLCLTATGCGSPEASRTRGGGPGADVQNRPAQVRMHEGSQPYWETPVVIDEEYPDLEPAQQARELSLK
jgi:hypothetical protein